MNQNETVFGEFRAHEQPTAPSRLLRPPTRSPTNRRGSGSKPSLKLDAPACYNLPYSAVRVDELWCPRASLNRPSAPLDTGAGGLGVAPLQSELGEQLG